MRGKVIPHAPSSARLQPDVVVRGKSGSRTEVWWRQDLSRMHPEDPHVREKVAEREQLVLAIAAVRTPRSARPRVVPLEARGEAALTAPASDAPKRPWVVRVHYVAGQDPGAGDRCYAEFGGLTEAGARELASAWSGHQTQAWSVRRPRERCEECDGEGYINDPPEPYRACKECGGAGIAEVPPPDPLPDHRRAEFPSESRCEPSFTVEP